MKLVITILIALGLAVGVALMSANDPGYVVLAKDPYVVRLPLLLFGLLLFIGFVLLYLLFNAIGGAFRLPKRYAQWRNQRNENNAHKYTMTGYAGLIAGDWYKAERVLLKKLEYNKTPLMNYLGAAYAAQQQGNMLQRNRYFDEALARHPTHQLAINLTRARLLYQAGEFSESRHCLEILRTSAPKNVPVVRLLADTYARVGAWSSLVDLVPVLKKLNAFPAQEMNQREQLAYDHLIASPALLPDGNRPATTWKSLPAARRKDPKMAASYARSLIEAREFQVAEKHLRSALNRKLDAELIYLYGMVESTLLEYQIQLVESIAKKQKQYRDHPDLLLTLARLYQRNQEYDKAKQHFKRVISAGGRDEAFMDLGALLEDMGDTDEALFYLKKGVQAMIDTNQSTTQQITLLEYGNESDATTTEEVMPVVR